MKQPHFAHGWIIDRIPAEVVSAGLVSIVLPHQVNTQYLHFRFHVNYSLLPWKIPEVTRRRSLYSSITKGSVYNINHMIQPFSMGVDRSEIRCLMEVSTMFYIYLQILHFGDGRVYAHCVIFIKQNHTKTLHFEHWKTIFL